MTQEQIDLFNKEALALGFSKAVQIHSKILDKDFLLSQEPEKLILCCRELPPLRYDHTKRMLFEVYMEFAKERSIKEIAKDYDSVNLFITEFEVELWLHIEKRLLTREECYDACNLLPQHSWMQGMALKKLEKMTA